MAGKKGLDSDSATALAVMQEEKDIERIKQEQQRQKEIMIAQCHEVIGQLKGVQLLVKFGDVASLVWLKEVKETKIYRDVPGIETWENFCESIGKSRRQIDEDLLNLQTFGDEFLGYVASLRVGYRELRKLRQLTHDGTIQINENALEISGERIPLDPDHKEDLQAAIEKIIEDQAALKAEMAAEKKAHNRVQEDTRKSMTKLQKDLDRLEAKAEARGYTADEAAFIDRMEGHRTLALGSMAAMEPQEIAQLFEELTPRMRAKVIANAHEIKMRALALYDSLVTEIGNHIINPELIEDFEKWEKENGFKQTG